MRNYWLIKEEPNKYSIDDLIKNKKTIWDGVKNNLALKNIRQIKKNDEIFYYHTGKEKAIVGIVSVIKDPYPDPNEEDDRYVVFDIKFLEKLNKKVTLSEIKSKKLFEKFELVRIPRLSVMPVTKKYWKEIIKLSISK